MPFSAGAIGPGEARLKAIEILIQNNISGANSALNRDASTSYLTGSRFGGVLTSAVVVQGDMDALWDESTGCLRICVCSGDSRLNLDFTSDREYIMQVPSAGVAYKYSTTINVYFHPDAFNDDDDVNRALRVALAQQRIADWITFGVLNHRDNMNLTLESQAMTDGGADYDELKMCMVDRCMSGQFVNGYMNIELPGLILSHSGTIS